MAAPPTEGDAAIGQQFTPAQAMQIASNFCTQIQAPVRKPGLSVYGFGDTIVWQGRERKRHWQGTWTVNFGGDVEINVLEPNGVVAFYYDYKLSRQLAEKPISAAISQDEAVRRATAILQAAGQRGDELNPATARLVTICSQPKAACRFWEVSWDRVAAGIPYHRQQARVLLQPENGALRALFLDFPTLPIAHPAFTVKPREAVSRAMGRLSAFVQAKRLPIDVRGLVLTQIKAELVEPNAAWPIPGEGNRPQDVQSAWKCVFTDPAGPIYEVWVDAQTGRVHGGDLSVPGGRIPTVQIAPSIQELLQKASEIRVYGSDKLLRWSKKPTAVLSARSHRGILQTLQVDGGAEVIKSLAIPRFKLEFISSGKPDATLWYVPEEGLIGYPGHWFTAPAAFKTWIKKFPTADR